MKTNEEPKVLYLPNDSSHPAGKRCLNMSKLSDNDIEYIRKDSFIEKVYNYLKNYAFVDDNKNVNLPTLLHDFLKDSRNF